MFRCNHCRTLLDENTPGLRRIINNQIETHDVGRCIIICPFCGCSKHIVGAESFFDEYTNKFGQITFKEDYEDSLHKNLPIVTAIPFFESTCIGKGNWAVTGVHPNYGSGILSWHQHKYQAICTYNYYSENSKYSGQVESKGFALGLTN